MSNVNATTYRLDLNSNVLSALREHESAALSLDRTMHGLRQTMEGVGIALGIREAIALGKEWIKDAAEYETSLIRIKNVSSSLGEGLKNQQFIRQEVNLLKLDLDKTTAGYGEFLAMVRGSGLASAEIRKLHDEVLTIGKVVGLPEGQMDAAVRNLGKLLEEGTLEGRHLRPLSYQMSGLMPYMSRELGVSNVELEKLLSSGKLTKAAIPSTVLIDAIEKYSNDMRGRLPESLNSTQSSINELTTAWNDFKYNFVLDHKEDIVEFFHELKDVIGWIRDHQEDLLAFAKTVFHIVEAYTAWRVIQLSVMGVRALWRMAFASDTALISSQTATTYQLIAAIERLNFVTNASTSSFITNAEGITMANTAANRYIVSSQASGVGAGAAAGAGAAGGVIGLGTVMLAAATIYITGEAILSWANRDVPGKNSDGTNDYSWGWGDLTGTKYVAGYGGATKEEQDRMEKAAAENARLNQGMAAWEDFSKDRELGLGRIFSPEEWEKYKKISGTEGENAYVINTPQPPEEASKLHKDSKDAQSLKNLLDKNKTSSIKGNSVTHITYHIHEINGIKNSTFEAKSERDLQNIRDVVGVELTKIMADSLNDAQVIKDTK